MKVNKNKLRNILIYVGIIGCICGILWNILIAISHPELAPSDRLLEYPWATIFSVICLFSFYIGLSIDKDS